MRHPFAVLILMAVLLLLVSDALADLVEISPANVTAEIRAEDESAVLVQFSLDAMPDGKLAVDEAYIEWRATLVSRPGREFVCHRLVAQPPMEGGNLGALEVGPHRESHWLEDAGEFAETNGVIRLDIRDAVRAWKDSPSQNFGLLIMCKGTSLMDLREPESLRLVVRYALVP